ncbi:MAG: cysteine methyltransferase [Dehalococcoidales bacterium]|nr:cysteine methyltransferase [Dehalococcoidales bacterium]
MTGELKYITFTTDMGWVGISSSARGLVRLTLPQPSAQGTLEPLGSSLSRTTQSLDSFGDIISRLRSYFGGKKTVFPDELDLSQSTHFKRQVWQITKLIPYGESRSYRWLAVKIGKPNAMRAVGQALAKNPLPIIIPCHRVVASNGKLGGYSGGLEMKKRLLHLEATGASVKATK